MTEIARMNFQSASFPPQHGALVLDDDGTVHMEPSTELRDEMARMEETALHRSEVFGNRLGIGLLLLGGAALFGGWAYGRIFGKIGSTFMRRRLVNHVNLVRDENGAIHFRLEGLEQKVRTIQLDWSTDEVDEDEATEFIETFERLKR